MLLMSLCFIMASLQVMPSWVKVRVNPNPKGSRLAVAVLVKFYQPIFLISFYSTKHGNVAILLI